MKNYEKPILIDMNDQVEGVYAASGVAPTPTPPTFGSLDIHCHFCNHNSGSHSEIAVVCEKHGGKSFDGIIMNFHIKDFRLDIVKDNSGFPVSNVSENGFTIFRQGHMNENDRFEFNIQVTCKDSKYHGSVGKTGDWLPCNVVCEGFRTC